MRLSVLVAFAPSSGELDTDLNASNEDEPHSATGAGATTPTKFERIKTEPGGVAVVEEPVICKGDISDFKADVEKGGCSVCVACHLLA